MSNNAVNPLLLLLFSLLLLIKGKKLTVTKSAIKIILQLTRLEVYQKINLKWLNKISQLCLIYNKEQNTTQPQVTFLTLKKCTHSIKFTKS